MIEQRSDGGVDVEYGSSDGPGTTEIRQIDPKERESDSEPETPSGPVEIDPTNPAQLP